MKDRRRASESGTRFPPIIHRSILSSGYSGKAHHNARLKQSDLAAAATMNHPDARLAGYQTSGDERVFGVLKPNMRLEDLAQDQRYGQRQDH